MNNVLNGWNAQVFNPVTDAARKELEARLAELMAKKAEGLAELERQRKDYLLEAAALRSKAKGIKRRAHDLYVEALAFDRAKKKILEDTQRRFPEFCKEIRRAKDTDDAIKTPLFTIGCFARTRYGNDIAAFYSNTIRRWQSLEKSGETDLPLSDFVEIESELGTWADLAFTRAESALYRARLHYAEARVTDEKARRLEDLARVFGIIIGHMKDSGTEK